MGTYLVNLEITNLSLACIAGAVYTPEEVQTRVLLLQDQHVCHVPAGKPRDETLPA